MDRHVIGATPISSMALWLSGCELTLFQEPSNEALDVAVIDVPALCIVYLDDQHHQQEVVERIAPRVVLLDTLLRLHGVDENSVADVVAQSLASCATSNAALRIPALAL